MCCATLARVATGLHAVGRASLVWWHHGACSVTKVLSARRDPGCSHAPSRCFCLLVSLAPQARQPKPEWMKRAPVPGGERYTEIKKKLRELKLHTVCEEAKCPNLGECWGGGDGHTATATIMLMGDTCTRACRFCAVKTGRSPPPLDRDEPVNVASAIAEWGLDYVVLTSVDRDDLADQGSGHFAQTIVNLKQRAPHMLVEALVPDFRGDVDCVQRVVESKLDVYAHNVETVPSQQDTVRDRRANWEQSVSTLVAAKRLARQLGHSRMLTKTSFMLGVGEQPGEVKEALQLLRAADVDVVTFGQYMRPTKGHMPVTEFVTPAAFQQWEDMAMAMGFKYAAGGPMVRSSYRAGEFFIKHMLGTGEGEKKATAST
jgi:lipoic acid synthetase